MTGNLHLGGLRTALFNYLFAKKHGGDFLLRIEDTDQKRYVEGSEEYIKKSLEWVGIIPDESPWNTENFRQSERSNNGIYTPFIEKLLTEGKAYYAFDTSEELDKLREMGRSYNHATRNHMRNSLSLSKEEVDNLIESGAEYTIRFKVDDNDDTVTINDMIRGEVTFRCNLMDDKVLVKSNGIPTYHLASVVDDNQMSISHVIRGEEWLPSVPLHVMLYNALEMDLPVFAHLPLILNPNGKGKLSKRAGITNGFSVFPLSCEVEDKKGDLHKMIGYDVQGYESSAFVNYLALLGWTPSDKNVEIMTIDEMISDFDMGRISKGGARFDLEKLNWVNSQHVNKLSSVELLSEEQISKYSEENINKIVELAKERAVFRHEVNVVFNVFFNDISSYADDSKINEAFKVTFSEFVNAISDIDFTDTNIIKNKIYEIGVKENGFKFGEFMPGLRQALSGGVSGPDLLTMMTILGKDVTAERLVNSIS